jgi:glucosamine-6-phosphate deaminase
MTAVSELKVDEMRVIVHRDTPTLARAAADEAAARIREAVAARGVANVMFATGNSQIAFIDTLVGATVDVPWSQVVVFHMDEYVGIGADHPASFRRWIAERISQKVSPRAAHYIDGTAEPEHECARYTDLLVQNPIDLCCLGIGENGHLAFNDPPVADFEDPTDVKVVALDEACRRQQVGEGHFRDVGSVPTHAITVTVSALLRAGRVLAVVPEKRKAAPVHEALSGPVSTYCPASILRTQAQVTLHLDLESASELNGDEAGQGNGTRCE